MKSNRINQKDKSAPGSAQSNNNSQAQQSSAVSPLSTKERTLLEKILGARLTELETIAEDLGISALDQLAGAAQAWIGFYQWQEDQGGKRNYSVEEMRKIAYTLNRDLYGYVVEMERQFWISPNGRSLYLDLLKRLKSMPVEDAWPVAEGLHNLLEHHPGFVDECKALDEFLRGTDSLGLSAAISPPKRASEKAAA